MLSRSGFVSANVHLSLDGEREINHTQWRSEEAFAAMQADPRCRQQMQAAEAFAASIDPHLCRVDAVHHAL